MVDINEALNKIIFKYDLDRYYPQYRNMYDAEKILRDMIEHIVKNNEKAVFVGDDKTGIAFVRNIAGSYADIHFIHYKRKDMTLRRLEEVKWQKYEKIFIISFYGAEYVERWFRMRNIRHEWIYDIFERGGVILQREFFSFGKEDLYSIISIKGNKKHTHDDWAESIQCELYCQQSKYENADECQTKHIALEKCLFLAFYMRNFLLAKKYVSILSENDRRYADMWQEVQDLLDMVKKSVMYRRQKDIILYWLDCISYNEADNMPYLQGIMQKSIVFEEAFTYMPHTHPALRAMFMGKKDIDDRVYGIKKFSSENSPVIRLLEEQGYHIKVISGYFKDCFPFQYVSDSHDVDYYNPASMRFWDLLSNMLLDSEKTLWIVHTMDTHPPYLSSRMSDNNYNRQNELCRLSRLEIDDQLAFYDSFIDSNVFRIYMSDHGRDKGVIHTEALFHILFNVYHGTWKPRKIKQFFSLLDFQVVLKQIILNGDIKEQEFEREYIEIGEFDQYAYWINERLFKNKEELLLGHLGVKGVIDKDYIYMRYSVGKEWLQKRNSMPLNNPLLLYDCQDDICEPELLPKYRKLTGEYPGDIILEEQFRYSRYLHDLYHNLLGHNHISECIDIINQLLMVYPDNSVAIRTGGIASSTLYYILPKESKRKIWGFIDRSNECLCSRFHLPIILPDRMEELEKYGVEAILLSSHIYLDMLRKEAKTCPADIDILDIYDCFEQNGIECEKEFYQVSGNKEDYDVGFPFGSDKS